MTKNLVILGMLILITYSFVREDRMAGVPVLITSLRVMMTHLTLQCMQDTSIQMIHLENFIMSLFSQ